MTRDDIIRMAREAGLGATLTHNGEVGQWIEGANWTEELERFAALISAAEREACAQVAESTVCDTHLPTGVQIYGGRVAKAIRARGSA